MDIKIKDNKIYDKSVMSSHNNNYCNIELFFTELRRKKILLISKKKKVKKMLYEHKQFGNVQKVYNGLGVGGRLPFS